MKSVSRVSTMIIAGAILAVGINFVGCSAMETAIKKRDLAVETKMSETIFLEPVAPKDKVIYFDIRNTSDQDVNIKESVIAAFENKGYVFTQDPNKATYMLQGNILKVSKSDAKEAKTQLGSGFDSALSGAVIAGGTSYAFGGGNRTTAGVALAGAAVGFLGDALASDVMYIMVTDLQIRERPLAGEVVTQSQSANLAQGSSSSTQQYIDGGRVQWKTYRTRIVSTANKMNLELEEAKPALESALAKSISGIF
ncbi:MAG: complement resistance protein TraT [Sulfurimonas sp.]|jgi:outer membrane lipoprotein SlyB|uniref:complement resistance protein TraT n=1 Tax=Sulfurimonas sp. TaxID=2022749 RepID=UPI00261FFC97|nr:complement resistance protein TraT [Sulfurimonas sp.]MDD3476398.1 complement resistance protein TraT [Sulfurimonas sp.]